MKISTVACLAAAAVACTASAVEMKMTPEEKKLLSTPYRTLSKEKKAQFDALTTRKDQIENGGEVVMPGTPAGTILFFSNQKKIPLAKFQPLLETFQPLNYDVRILDKPDPSLKVLARVDVVDDPAAPSVAVYPDEARAVVNIAKLGDEKTKPAFLAARTRKQMLRAFCYATAGSSYGTPLFARLKSVKDLDDIADEGFPMDIMMRTCRFLDDQGAKPLEYVSYVEVLKLGFDLKPQNDFQKAIYEEYKAKGTLTKKPPETKVPDFLR